MAVAFIGHGSPMNAIEDNDFTKGWQKIASIIENPSAILCVSAHWVTKGTRVRTVESPKTIHDFYGFPKELYDIEYNAKGSHQFSQKTLELLSGIAVEDNSWGIDHGAWSVLRIMYPKADIPVFQVSIDTQASKKELFEIGKKLKKLREENVFILGSGNVVHNLGAIDFSMNGGFDWAYEFDNYIKQKVEQRDFNSILDYSSFGKNAKYSVPTSEHFDPLIYILGATNKNDKLEIYNNECVFGSLSMTSYIFL